MLKNDGRVFEADLEVPTFRAAEIDVRRVARGVDSSSLSEGQGALDCMQREQVIRPVIEVSRSCGPMNPLISFSSPCR